MYSMCCSPCAIGTTLSNTVGKMNYKSQPTYIHHDKFIYPSLTFPLFLGMPFFMGCCCVSMCGARNLVRYQYRIGGDECFDDFCLPFLLWNAAYCSTACFGPAVLVCPCFLLCSPCCMAGILGVYSYFVAVIMKILQESELQLKARGGVPGFYLSSPPASMNDNRAVFPSTAVYVNNDNVTVPVNAQYVPVPSTVELGNHAAGGGPGQYSYVPTAVAAEESSNTVTKNYV